MERLPEVLSSDSDAKAQQSRRLDLGRFHVGHVHRDVEREQVDVFADVSGRLSSIRMLKFLVSGY